MANEQLSLGFEYPQRSKRVIHGTINPELKDLISRNPTFTDEYNEFEKAGLKDWLCTHTPSNIIGSLLIGLYPSFSQMQYHALQLPVPTGLSKPISIMENVPLTIMDSETESLEPLEVKAERVLIKHACNGEAKPAGVVIQGPLTGTLVFKPRHYLPDQPTMIATRLWNNEKLPQLRPPYRANILRHLPDILTPHQQKLLEYRGMDVWDKDIFVELWEQRFNRLYCKSEAKYIATHQEHDQLHFFFFLAEQAGITVDKEHFTYTSGM